MQGNGLLPCQVHKLGIDLIPAEYPQPLCLLRLIPHGDPGVGDQNVRSSGRLLRLLDHPRASAQCPGLFQYLGLWPIPGWGGYSDLHPQDGRGQNQGVADVVPIPNPADLQAIQSLEVLAHGLEVGQYLERMLPVGQGIDHRDAGVLRQLEHSAVRVDPGGDAMHISGQHPGRIGYGLPPAQLQFVGR